MSPPSQSPSEESNTDHPHKVSLGTAALTNSPSRQDISWQAPSPFSASVQACEPRSKHLKPRSTTSARPAGAVGVPARSSQGPCLDIERRLIRGFLRCAFHLISSPPGPSAPSKGRQGTARVDCEGSTPGLPSCPAMLEPFVGLVGESVGDKKGRVREAGLRHPRACLRWRRE